MKPKVLLAVPYYRMIEDGCKKAIEAIVKYEASRKAIELAYTQYDFALVSFSRNYFAKKARDMNYDFLLMIDSDTIPPKDTIERLLRLDKDIACGTICARGDETGKPLMITCANQQYVPHERDVIGIRSTFPLSGVIEVHSIPTACIMIKASVFDKTKLPAFYETPDYLSGNIITEDWTFCNLARGAGLKIWCDIDLSKEIGHIDYKTKVAYYPKFEKSPLATRIVFE